MSELERAREHLAARQFALRNAREMNFHGLMPREFVKTCEASLLAALSWAWDAQERAKPSLRMLPDYDGYPFVSIGWDLSKEAGGGSFSSTRAR